MKTISKFLAITYGVLTFVLFVPTVVMIVFCSMDLHPLYCDIVATLGLLYLLIAATLALTVVLTTRTPHSAKGTK